jgi:exopolysaccharide production protein ExoQ
VPLSALIVPSVVGAAGITALGFNAGDLMTLVGRSSDLTGRTELWGSVLKAIQERPILGYGFSGFWRGAAAESEAVATQLQWAPIYSHNGYLEISLSLGVVGLALAVALLVVGFRRAWAQSAAGSSLHSSWPLALMAFVAIHNLTECTIALQNCLEWSVCVATIAASDPWAQLSLEAAGETEDMLPNSVETQIA